MFASFPIAVIFASSLVTMMLSYRGRALIWGEDANLPLSIDDIDRYFQVSARGLDGPDVRGLPFIMPMGAILWVWLRSGAPYDASVFQFCLLTTLLSASGLSTYWLIRSFFMAFGRAAACVGALFYMFNLYSLTTIWSPLSNLVFHYALLPLVVGLLLHAFRRRTFTSAVVAAIVWTLTLTPAYTTPPIAITDLLLFLGIAIFFVLRDRRWRDRLETIGLFGTVGLVWLGLNLFWIIPVAYYAGGEYSRLFVDTPAEHLFEVNSASFLDAIRLDGYWGLESDYQGDPYFSWALYYQGIVEVLGFVLPVFAALTLLAVARKELHHPETASYLLLFAVILAAGLFFITGPNPPLGDAKDAIFSHLRLSGVFRSVYQRFGVYVALAYVPLVAGGTHLVATRAASMTRRDRAQVVYAAVVVATIALIPGVLGWPLWSGQAYDRSGIFPSDRIEVPEEYKRVASWIDSKEGDFAVLAFPFAPGPAAALRWNDGNDGYRGIEPLSLLSSKPLVSSSHGASYIEPLVFQASKGGRRAWPALRLLNVRYVVVHMDANPALLRGLPTWIGIEPRAVDDALARVRELRMVLAGPMLRVYEVMPWRPFRLFAIAGDPGESLYAMDFEHVQPVRYRVIEGKRYLLRGSELEATWTLVLNHPFDSNWRANSRRATNTPPGLTSFRDLKGDEIVVRHRLDRHIPLLLLAIPDTLVLAFCGVVAVRLRRKRGQSSALDQATRSDKRTAAPSPGKGLIPAPNDPPEETQPANTERAQPPPNRSGDDHLR